MDQSSLPEAAPRKPNRWRHRIGIALGILIIGWTIIWFGYARFLEQQAENFFVNADTVVSQQLRSTSRSIKGYPFSWFLTLEAPEISDQQTGTRIVADQARIGFSLPDYRNFKWQAMGDILLRLPVPTNNSALPIGHVTVQAKRADGYFTLSNTGPRDPHLSFHDVTISLGDPPNGLADKFGDENTINLDQQTTTSESLSFNGPLQSITIDEVSMALIAPVWPALKAGDPALTIDTNMINIAPNLAEDDPRQAQLTRGANDQFGNIIDRFGFQFTLSGPLPQGVHHYALRRWRDGGGTVLLDRLNIDIGDVSLFGTGLGFLDASLQPSGTVGITLRGHELVLNRLVTEGTIKPLMAEFTRTMLRQLITTDEDGNQVLSADLGVQDRWLKLGPIQLIRIPPVIWAGAQ